jgi:hypothetical protein
MKTIKTYALSISFLSLTFIQPNLPQNPAGQPVDSTESANTTFQHGEKLTYKIYYNWNFVWLAAGEVTFQVTDEGEQYHYHAYGETYDSYEWFFTVKDSYDSWVDKNSLLPTYSERSINEGDYHIFEKITFNQAAKKMTVWRAKKRGEARNKNRTSWCKIRCTTCSPACISCAPSTSPAARKAQKSRSVSSWIRKNSRSKCATWAKTAEKKYTAWGKYNTHALRTAGDRRQRL